MNLNQAIRWEIILLLYLTLSRCLFALQNKKPISNKTCKKSSKTFLWSINTEIPTYFFGTIHVPYTQVWEHIPQKIKNEFRSSNIIYFELDLLNYQTILQLNKCQILPNRMRLRNVISRELYIKLRNYLRSIKKHQKNQLNYYRRLTRNWRFKKPIWIIFMLIILFENNLNSFLYRVPILDLYLAQEAKKLGKQIDSIESVQDQCLPINLINNSDVIFILNTILNNQENIEKEIHLRKFNKQNLIDQYNCQILDEKIFLEQNQLSNVLKKYLTEEEKQKFNYLNEYFKQELILKRNYKIFHKVIQQIKLNSKYKKLFFIFGSAHFIGNNSILDYLQKSGFVVERVKEELDEDYIYNEEMKNIFENTFHYQIYKFITSYYNNNLKQANNYLDMNAKNKNILLKSYNNFWLNFKINLY